MDNISVNSVSTISSCMPSDSRRVLKTYTLNSEQSLDLVFDAISGLKGVLHENDGTRVEISFYDLVGIPRSLQFNCQKLTDWLDDDDTRAKREAGQILILPRGLGGGGSFSKQVQTFSRHEHDRSPPPPETYYFSFSSPHVIRKIEHIERKFNDGGWFQNERGGVGSTSYHIEYELPHGMAYAPKSICLYAWRRDVFRDAVTDYTNKYRSALEKKQSIVKKQMHLQAKVSELDLLQLQIKNCQNQLDGIRASSYQADMEKSSLSSRYDELVKLRDRLKAKIRAEGPDIRALIEAVLIIHQLGIPVFQAPPPALQEFNNRELSIAVDHWVGEKVNAKGLLGSSVLNLAPIVAQSQLARGQSIVAVVGSTGTGKSTVINHWLGSKIELRGEGFHTHLVVADGDREFSKIGHSKINSETVYTQVFSSLNLPFRVADCGGYFDTRGLDAEMTAMTSLTSTLSSANNVKLLLAFNSNSLNERAVSFFEALEMSLCRLLVDYAKHRNSFAVVFTKPYINYRGRVFDSEMALEILRGIKEELAHEPGIKKDLCNLVLRERGKYVFVYNPLVDSSREGLLEIVNDLTPIRQPSGIFRVAISPQASKEIGEVMIQTATVANELFHAAKDCQNSLNQIAEEYDYHATNRFELEKAWQASRQNQEKLEDQLKILAKDKSYSQLDQINKVMSQIDDEIDNSQSQIKALDVDDHVFLATVIGKI